MQLRLPCCILREQHVKNKSWQCRNTKRGGNRGVGRGTFPVVDKPPKV